MCIDAQYLSLLNVPDTINYEIDQPDIFSVVNL